MNRVAFLTPLPPERTGIADYAATVLQHLVGRVELDVFCSHPHSRPLPGVRVRRAGRGAMRRLDRYDAVVAQVGNSPAHEWIVEWIRARPTSVVLHELVLHHLVAHMTLGRGDYPEYVKLLSAAGGGHEVTQVLAGLSGRGDPVWERSSDRYPLTGYVTQHATSLLVHSRHLRTAVRAQGFAGEVAVVPFPALPANTRKRTADADTVTFGVFGFITPNKRLPVVLRAMRLILGRVNGVRLLVVGGSPAGLDPAEMARRAGLPDTAVHFERYPDRANYQRLLDEVDIGVCLRHPTFGETSAVVVDFLSRATPVVVSTGGWYDELPDGAVARVPPGDDEEFVLAAALEHLSRDIPRRRAMGEYGYEYARSVLDPSQTADAYLRALLAPLGRPVVERALEHRLAGSVASVVQATGASAAPLAAQVGAAAASIGLLAGRHG